MRCVKINFIDTTNILNSDSVQSKLNELNKMFSSIQLKIELYNFLQLNVPINIVLDNPCDKIYDLSISQINLFKNECKVKLGLINCYMVNSITGKDASGNNCVLNGCAMYGKYNKSFIIAKGAYTNVLFHELLHTIGLSHDKTNIKNLMYPGSNGNNNNLDQTQLNIIDLSSNFFNC
jgi:hypothetical protein